MADSRAITPSLRAIVDRIPDRGFSEKLLCIYQAAAHAVSQLEDLDLLKYEETVAEGVPDLSLWEELAPVIRDTVLEVNNLLNTVRENFPEGFAARMEASIADAIEGTGPLPPGLLMVRRYREAESAIRDAAEQLAHQITLLGERMRTPSVVSDRWNLLADVQAFRERFRKLIGEAVFQSAAAFGQVHRKDVVPGYQQSVAAAVVVRAAVTDLLRVTTARIEEVRTAEAEDIQWHAKQLEKDLDAFGRTHAYKALRAQDKRVVVEYRHALGKCAVRSRLEKRELLGLTEPFGSFVASLSRVSQREILALHDREICAACGVRIEQAATLVNGDPRGAARALGDAVAAAQALYGRDPTLDLFLRKTRKAPINSLGGPELVSELEKFRTLLAALT